VLANELSERALAFIDEHYSEPMSGNDLPQVAGLNQNRFATLP